MVGLEEREGFQKIKIKKTAVFPVDMRSHSYYACVCSLQNKTQSSPAKAYL